ncbi:hypothetical protein HDU93_008352 [Gonapodya sp. JEL0774]|nr:hypothetical protein HDU93_008352 [Gonapodya sp. JEL0774]
MDRDLVLLLDSSAILKHLPLNHVATALLRGLPRVDAESGTIDTVDEMGLEVRGPAVLAAVEVDVEHVEGEGDGPPNYSRGDEGMNDTERERGHLISDPTDTKNAAEDMVLESQSVSGTEEGMKEGQRKPESTAGDPKYTTDAGDMDWDTGVEQAPPEPDSWATRSGRDSGTPHQQPPPSPPRPSLPPSTSRDTLDDEEFEDVVPVLLAPPVGTGRYEKDDQNLPLEDYPSSDSDRDFEFDASSSSPNVFFTLPSQTSSSSPFTFSHAQSSVQPQFSRAPTQLLSPHALRDVTVAEVEGMYARYTRERARAGMSVE